MIYWTGIGSRALDRVDNETMWNKLVAIGGALTVKGYMFRSGDALGADTAFLMGVDKVDPYLKELYIPWHTGGKIAPWYHLPTLAASAIAREIHPVYSALKPPAKKLHDRNVHQVLGQDLKTPSSICVAWTPSGKAEGGSATAINVSIKNSIPVINLGEKQYKTMKVERIVKQIIQTIEEQQ